MSHHFHCDECGDELMAPIQVCYMRAPADDETDDDDLDETADFCSWGCLAAWGTREAVEQACDTLE